MNNSKWIAHFATSIVHEGGKANSENVAKDALTDFKTSKAT